MEAAEKILGLALHVCDEVIEDAKTGKKSLIGLFNRIVSARFPCVHPKLHVFVSITGGRGRRRAELRCVNQSTRAVLLSSRGEISFSNPNAVIDVNFLLTNVTFPEPGSYSFEFLCDGELVFDRLFTVQQARKGPPPGPPRPPGPTQTG